MFLYHLFICHTKNALHILIINIITTAKSRGLRSRLLYLPRIDLWAMEEAERSNTVDNILSMDTPKSSNNAMHGKIKSSQAWDSFLEQVDPVCSSSLIILVSF